jgi:hypothetical protein
MRKRMGKQLYHHRRITIIFFLTLKLKRVILATVRPSSRRQLELRGIFIRKSINIYPRLKKVPKKNIQRLSLRIGVWATISMLGCNMMRKRRVIRLRRSDLIM